MHLHDVAYYRARAERERSIAVSQALKSFARWVVAPRRRESSHVAIQH